MFFFDNLAKRFLNQGQNGHPSVCLGLIGYVRLAKPTPGCFQLVLKGSQLYSYLKIG
jgi:hypothetical protein